MGSAPKPPPPSAEELAMTRRQRIRLDEEIAQNEARLKQQARGRLGKKSLLTTPISMATVSGAQAGDITEGFIKSKTTGQTLKVPTAPGGRGQAAAARFKRQHGVGGDGGMRRTRADSARPRTHRFAVLQFPKCLIRAGDNSIVRIYP